MPRRNNRKKSEYKQFSTQKFNKYIKENRGRNYAAIRKLKEMGVLPGDSIAPVNRAVHNKKTEQKSQRGTNGVQHPIPTLERPVTRGSVWFIRFGHQADSSVQGGCRPALVISNDAGNRNSTIINVIPFTTKMKRTYIPSHVVVDSDCVESVDAEYAFTTSMAMVEQVTTVGTQHFVHYIGEMTDMKKLSEIEDALLLQLGFDI